MADPHPLLADVMEYLGAGTTKSAAEVSRAIYAEEGHQARCCRVPDPLDTTPAAEATRKVLLEALCRRVAVNLARRGLPLGMQTTDVGTARVTTKDPEVRRLEGPYRKVVFG